MDNDIRSQNVNINNQRQDKKECIPDQTKGSSRANGMLDKGLSQMKSIQSNKGPRFYDDEKHQKKKLSHLKFTCERIQKLQTNINF